MSGRLLPNQVLVFVRKGVAMSRVLRVSIVLAAAAGLACVIAGYVVDGSQRPTDVDKGIDVSQSASQPAVDGASAEATQLAARYHLRNRTKRFFNRSSVRGNRGRRCAVEGQQDPADGDGIQLAARYHLRGRTARFFRRSAV